MLCQCSLKYNYLVRNTSLHQQYFFEVTESINVCGDDENCDRISPEPTLRSIGVNDWFKNDLYTVCGVWDILMSVTSLAAALCVAEPWVTKITCRRHGNTNRTELGGSQRSETK